MMEFPESMPLIYGKLMTNRAGIATHFEGKESKNDFHHPIGSVNKHLLILLCYNSFWALADRKAYEYP